jgi:hypothetical protein
MFKIGRGREPYLEEGHLHLTAHGEYLAEYKRRQLENDFALWKGMNPIANLLDELRQEAQKTQYSAGTRLYQSYSDFEKLAYEEGRRGDTTAAEIAAKLAAKRPAGPGKKPEDEATFVDAGSQAGGMDTQPATPPANRADAAT